MTKKKISLIQAIIQLVAIASLFIPVSFIRYFTNIGTMGTYQYSESLISVADISNNLFVGVLLIITSAIALTYFILYFSTDIDFIRKNFCIVVPCLSLLLLIICVSSVENAVSSGAKYSEVYGTDWGFYMICALYLSILVLELFRRFSKIDEEKRVKIPSTTVIQPASSAEELQKYSELLAKGIITQEEFDAKKKQLLGL